MTDPTPEQRFEHAKACFFAGLEAFGRGRFDDAEAHYLASLAAVPGRVSTLINLAATRLELGRPQDALAAADQALAGEPDSTDALLHRGSALTALDRPEAALVAFERLLALDATHSAARLRLAHALERTGRPLDALAAYDRLLADEPSNADAWTGRGGLLRELQQPAEAAAAFRLAMQHGADPELHAYYLASVDAGQAPAAAPRGYVAALFDDYADAFDAHLVDQLHYRAHEQLVDGALALADRARPTATGRFRHALDLGCGTGLCGPPLRPFVDRLTGVDLAPRMLAKARERGAYDQLVHGEIVDWLSGGDLRFDLVLAADVFIYIGELAPVFAAVRRRLGHRGVFGFTVEAPDDPAADFILRPSLRYAHGERYLRRLAVAHGYAFVSATRATVREDQRLPIEGTFVYLRAAD